MHWEDFNNKTWMKKWDAGVINEETISYWSEVVVEETLSLVEFWRVSSKNLGPQLLLEYSIQLPVG